MFAAGRAEIGSCVAFYPDPEQTMKVLSKIAAPTLAIFAGDDPATKAGVPQFEAAAAASRRSHTVKVFPGSMRGFHDPAATKVYKPELAKEGTLTIQHLDANLREKTTGAGVPDGGK
jgi:dienelactone hydrolase